MIRNTPKPLALAALAFAAFAAAAGAGETAERQEKLNLIWNTDGASDRLEIEELDLAPGESRTFTTESGRTATVTREEGDAYTIDVDGREIRVGGDDELLPGQRVKIARKIVIGEGGDPETVVLSGGEAGERHVVRKIVVDGDGETKSFVVSDGDPDVVFLRGKPGDHGFAFSTGGPPRFVFDHLLERIEKSEKFLALDDATRELVRGIVRDAAPKLERLPGEDGDDGVQVILERKVEKSDGD